MIADPPGRPEISGLNEGSVVKEGKNQKLLCKTKAGKPPAQLVWYMGEHMMNSQYSVNGDTVQAQITFVPRLEDNGSELRCEATNEAVTDPVVNTVILDVDRVTPQITEDDYYNTDNYEYLENDTYIDEWMRDSVTDNSMPEYHHPEEVPNELEETPRKSEGIQNDIIHNNFLNQQSVDEHDNTIKDKRSKEQETKEHSSGSENNDSPLYRANIQSSSERVLNNVILTAIACLFFTLR